MNPLDVILSNRERPPLTGVVSSFDAPTMTANVVVGGTAVPASLVDHVLDTIAVGSLVTLRPIGDTYELTATHTGSTGSGGVIYGPELLPNPSFEFGAAGADGWSAWPWVAGTYTAGRDTSPGESVSGDARMLVTLTGGDTNPAVNLWNSLPIRVDEAATYQAAAWVKAPVGDASLVVQLIVYTAPEGGSPQPFGSGATQQSVATVTNPGAAYQLLVGSFTAPAGHEWLRLHMRATADAAIAAPVTVSWDSASLRQTITS